MKNSRVKLKNSTICEQPRGHANVYSSSAATVTLLDNIDFKYFILDSSRIFFLKRCSDILAISVRGYNMTHKLEAESGIYNVMDFYHWKVLGTKKSSLEVKARSYRWAQTEQWASTDRQISNATI